VCNKTQNELRIERATAGDQSTTKENRIMRTLATLTAAAFLAGMSFAVAQNSTAPIGTGNASPSNLNATPNDGGGTVKSGSETPGAAVVKGSAAVKSTAGTGPSASPAAANATPNDGGGNSMSGSQPQRTVNQSGGASTTGTATTGPTAISPADANAKPPASK
jgi:hypothetical protein